MGSVAALLMAAILTAGCAEAADSAGWGKADDGGPAQPAAAASSAPTTDPTPVVTYQRIRVKDSLPFKRVLRTSADIRKGVVRVQQSGRPGVRVKVYRITLEDGVEVGRTMLRNYIARPAMPRIKVRGTYVPPPKPEPVSSCDSNYSGACVPIASDVDCGGGSGNGPAYVNGPVRVEGYDIYDLDADGDGWACD